MLSLNLYYPFAVLLCTILATLIALDSEAYRLAPPGYLSLLLELVFFCWCYVLLDALAFFRTIRTFLAGVFALLASCYAIDSLLLATVASNLFELIPTLLHGGKVADTLRETGLTNEQLIILTCSLVFVFLLGCIAHRRTMSRTIKCGIPSAILVLICVAGAFFGEQVLARKHNSYALRQITLPLYWRVFDAKGGSTSLKLAVDNEEAKREALELIGSAGNPKNVLYVLLESVRADSLRRELMPALSALAEKSVYFENARTEAIYSPLAWHVLFSDRPAFRFAEDVERPEGIHHAYPFRVLKRAGYENYLAISGNFEWNGYRRRIAEAESAVDHVFLAHSGDYARRDENDALVVNQVAKWIVDRDATAPFFILLQLDGTHWPYYFDGAPAYNPAQALSATKQARNELRRRYDNALGQVDAQIAKILELLHERDIADDTIVIVTSDHGEEFSRGVVGHSVLTKNVKHVPLFMFVPGVKPQRRLELVNHRVIFPTLWSYLEVTGREGLSMLGRSYVENKQGERSAALTMHGSLMLADLETAEEKVRFFVQRRPNELRFTPLGQAELTGDKRPWLAALRGLIQR